MKVFNKEQVEMSGESIRVLFQDVKKKTRVNMSLKTQIVY